MDRNDGCALVFIIIVFLFAGFLAGACAMQSTWEDKTISMELAEYNQKTGEWQWKKEYAKKKEVEEK